jgi:hypothetical protein
LKPPSESSADSGSGVVWLAHQTSQIDPRTGIFNTTSKKKIAQNPVIAQV